jgi:Major Facilitator Superfamily
MAENQNDSQSLRAFTPVLIMLAICILINYVDRGNLSIAAPLLKDELGISASQLGILLAAFFWTYTAMQFLSGWLVDRFDVNLVIAAGLPALVDCDGDDWHRARFHNAVNDAFDARDRRIGSIPVLLENPGAACSGIPPRICKWCHPVGP